MSLKWLKIVLPLEELVDPVATERSGCTHCHWGCKLLRKVHGQGVLTWILEGLSRRVPFKVFGTVILGAGKVQKFAERGRS